MRTRNWHRWLLALIILSLILGGCDRGKDKSEAGPARYGEPGRSLAIDLAERFPNRLPGSADEAAALNFLADYIQKAGLLVERQAFSFVDGTGQTQSSANLVVHIQGKGLMAVNKDHKSRIDESASMQPPQVLQGRRLIMGAHYDRGPLLIEGGIRTQGMVPNGLHDNAAAVAALVKAAELMAAAPPPYDVDIVFFGAGHEAYAGAKAYAQNLSQEALALIDGVFILDSVYAGDKVYAHSGRNSLLSARSKDYAMRRKLYEATDIYYDNLLLTRNNFALFTNQSLCSKDWPSVGPVAYREWTLRESDYLPFDALGLPIVFFDSGDYDQDDCSAAFQESGDPYFAESQGLIQGSSFDNAQFLTAYFVAKGQAAELEPFGSADEAKEAEAEAYILRTDRLQIRVNNLAFILTELAKKTPPQTQSR